MYVSVYVPRPQSSVIILIRESVKTLAQTIPSDASSALCFPPNEHSNSPDAAIRDNLTWSLFVYISFKQHPHFVSIRHRLWNKKTQESTEYIPRVMRGKAGCGLKNERCPDWSDSYQKLEIAGTVASINFGRNPRASLVSFAEWVSPNPFIPGIHHTNSTNSPTSPTYFYI